MGVIVKILQFENLFDRMREQWEISELNGEIHILDEITKQGSKMGTLYRSKDHENVYFLYFHRVDCQFQVVYEIFSQFMGIYDDIPIDTVGRSGARLNITVKRKPNKNAVV